jgi:hypothetical protein
MVNKKHIKIYRVTSMKLQMQFCLLNQYLEKNKEFGISEYHNNGESRK